MKILKNLRNVIIVVMTLLVSHEACINALGTIITYYDYNSSSYKTYAAGDIIVVGNSPTVTEQPENIPAKYTSSGIASKSWCGGDGSGVIYHNNYTFCRAVGDNLVFNDYFPHVAEGEYFAHDSCACYAGGPEVPCDTYHEVVFDSYKYTYQMRSPEIVPQKETITVFPELGDVATISGSILRYWYIDSFDWKIEYDKYIYSGILQRTELRKDFDYKWDLRNSDGTPYPTGIYKANITLTSQEGLSSVISKAVQVKVKSCQSLDISSFNSSRDTFSPQSGETAILKGSIAGDSEIGIGWYLFVNDKMLTGTGANATFEWNGKDSNGDIVAPGTYYAMLMAFYEIDNGRKCYKNKTVTVKVNESCGITIDSLIGSNTILNPFSGGRVKISGSISNNSGQPVTWTLDVAGKTFTGNGNSANVSWDGKDAIGKVVEPGSYSAILSVQTVDGKCTETKKLDVTVTEAANGQCGLYVQFGSSAHMANGNLSHSQTLFSTRGGISPVQMTLYYNSLDATNGSMGRGWSHNYDLTLKENSDGSVLISEGNWRNKYYMLANGAYSSQVDNNSTLVKNTEATFTLTHKDGQLYTFANGKVASITDRNGNTTSFAYSSGNLATVTDPSERVISFAYDAANHLTSLTDPSGNVYAFTVGDTLTSVTQPDGGVWRYSYDANSFMLTKTDPLGNSTGYAYDDQHRVTTATDPEGQTRSIAYPQTSDSVKTSSFTEKDGGVWSYSYDTQSGYLLGKTDPQGGTTSYGYDANGNRTSITNPDGTSTSATYDGTGNMLTSTDAMGLTTGYTYNSFRQVTGITDPQGGTTSYTYDAKGNMTGLTDSTGATTTYAYDDKGNITKITDPAGLVTSFTYDTTGNLATVTDSSGATSKYAYDAAGNVTSITDAKAAVTQFIYDSRNRLIKSIDPNGNATLYSYDANGNKLSDTDANGNITKYEYNGKNQLIKTIDALSNATIYSYGGNSCPSCGGGNGEKLTTLTDANGNSTSYLYDQLGRLSKETDPKGNATSYAYDAKGNLIAKTDANGNTTSYSYDGNGRLLKKRYPDNTEEAFTYDPKGNILSATNKDIAYNFSYDAAGRMTSSMDSNSRYLQYSYDNTGRKTKTIYPEGSVVSYAYDTAGRLAAITNGGGRTYSYSYDKLGRRSKLTYPNGATANYAYDTTGRLTNLEHKTSGNKIISSFSYTYDKVGNRLTKTDQDTTWNYGYDAVYRLLQALSAKQNKEKDEGNYVEKFSYDPTGNRLTGADRHTAYTYGPGNELLAALKLAYTYDKNGNLTGKARKLVYVEENEKERDGKQWQYTYDFENRLIKAEKKEGQEATVVTFSYDPLGRRIGKKVEKQEHGKTEEVASHTYVYDGQNIILEYATEKDDDHRPKTTKYVHGAGIDEHLSMENNGEVLFYHSDGLGSVIALTDKKQKTVEKYEYDSFGNLKGGKNPSQPFTYTGRIWDAETGLYDYRARTYDSSLGRFISRDPLGFKAGDVNLYGYTKNNPINKKDPSGLFTVSGDCCGKEKTMTSEINNACNILSATITDPALRGCISKRCKNAKIECESNCRSNLLGYNNSFLGIASSSIHICVGNCTNNLFGPVAIHEWAHSCGWDHGDGGGVPGDGGAL